MKNLLISAIRVYQKFLSPLKNSSCPFDPSCSAYGIRSINEYGAIKGLILTIWRILRCNPFNKGYHDPPKHWGNKFGFKPAKSKKEPDNR